MTVASLSNRKMETRVTLPATGKGAFQPLLTNMAKAGAEGQPLELGPFGYFVGKRSSK